MMLVIMDSKWDTLEDAVELLFNPIVVINIIADMSLNCNYLVTYR